VVQAAGAAEAADDSGAADDAGAEDAGAEDAAVEDDDDDELPQAASARAPTTVTPVKATHRPRVV
jgi:hypothetical protein